MYSFLKALFGPFLLLPQVYQKQQKMQVCVYTELLERTLYKQQLNTPLTRVATTLLTT